MFARMISRVGPPGFELCAEKVVSDGVTERILKFFTGRGKGQHSVPVIVLQKGKMFPFELITQNLYRNEKCTFGSLDFPVGAQTAAGHDTMHTMYMVIQFLVPCVEDLDDTGCCSEILPVSG